MKNKKIIFISIFFILVLTLSFFVFKNYDTSKLKGDVSNSNTINVGDAVFFDPVTSNTCNNDNYWTIYDQSTTCYKWFVIEVQGQNLTLLLDHNYSNKAYTEVSSELLKIEGEWENYNGNIGLLTENQAATLMEIGDSRPTSSSSIASRISKQPRWLCSNIYNYMDGSITTTSGFWLNEEYPDDTTRQYNITEGCNFGMTKKTSVRGVRPVITLSTTKIVRDREITINPILDKKFLYSTIKQGGKTYKQMQGFVYTDDLLIYASTNGGNEANSLIFRRSLTDYKTIKDGKNTVSSDTIDQDNYMYVEKIGHANGMSYDKDRNEILVSGLSGGYINQVWIFDKDFNYKTSVCTYKDSTAYNYDVRTATENPCTGSNIINYGISHAYGNYYFAHSGNFIFLLERKEESGVIRFEIRYSFPLQVNETLQDYKYKDGYLYYSVHESGGNSSYALITDSDRPESNKVYIYNVKINEDNTLSKSFGRQVQSYYIPREIDGTTPIELEGIQFRGDVLYFGFASQKSEKDSDETDNPNTLTNYVYRFYKASNLVYKSSGPNYEVNLEKKSNGKYEVTVTSDEDIVISGFAPKNNNKKELVKEVDPNTIFEIEVCSVYNECNSKEIVITMKEKENNYFLLDTPTIANDITISSTSSDISIKDGTTNITNTSNKIKTGTKLIIDNKTYYFAIKGDLNKDGNITISDVSKIYRATKGTTTLSEIEEVAGDYNENGTINITDVSGIYRMTR
ncbi:MAG: dockerin type I repeat-containing protein [Bacilli bacterium]|nr:dockerin type I repeat-containing protein [Bacilli bacterium]